MDTRWEVEHVWLFFVLLASGLVDMSLESLIFEMPEILKNRCDFKMDSRLREPLHRANSKAENLKLAAPWKIFGCY